jgi:hypothetical protein
MRLSGKVISEQVARGSKSARAAILLASPLGRLILRRVGGHAFADEQTRALLGKTVTVNGERRGQYFFYRDAVIEDQAA